MGSVVWKGGQSWEVVVGPSSLEISVCRSAKGPEGWSNEFLKLMATESSAGRFSEVRVAVKLWLVGYSIYVYMSLRLCKTGN